MPAIAGITAPTWPYDASGGLVDAIDDAMRYNAKLVELMTQRTRRLYWDVIQSRSDVSERWALFEQWDTGYVEVRPAKLGNLLRWLDDAARRGWLYEKIAWEAYGDYWVEPAGDEARCRLLSWVEPMDDEARRRLISEVDNAGRPTVFYFEHRQTGERVPLTGRWLHEFYRRYASWLDKRQNTKETMQ